MQSVLAAAVVILWCTLSTSDATNLCTLPLATGMCRAYMPSYFYNATSCRCEKFIYSGCGGNENRFTTLDECQSTCDGTPCAICDLPLLLPKIRCLALMRFWYFDPTSCQCQVASGCSSGNANYFRTKEDCEGMCGDHRCRCNTPRVMGRCGDQRWFYNDTSNVCQRFMSCDEMDYGNNFSSRQDCNNICRNGCSLPRFVGSDSGNSQRRFFYNRRRNRCVRFRWGGAVSNANNFRRRRGCIDTCVCK